MPVLLKSLYSYRSHICIKPVKVALEYEGRSTVHLLDGKKLSFIAMHLFLLKRELKDPSSEHTSLKEV